MKPGTVLAIAVMSAPFGVGAQLGQVTTSAYGMGLTTEVSAIVIRVEGDVDTHWLRGVVLFRVTGPQLPYGSPAALERQRRGAEASERWRTAAPRGPCGGGARNEWWYAMDCSARIDTIRIGNRSITIADGDSAAVVMVDQPDVDPATWRVVDVRRVAAFAPRAFFPRRWTSGDTLFTEEARDPRAVLLQHLGTDPVVVAFLRGRTQR